MTAFSHIKCILHWIWLNFPFLLADTLNFFHYALDSYLHVF